MDIFDLLTMIGGLCLFLFGMTVMGQALERRAGNALRSVLAKLTTKKSAGFLTGLGITAVIQSSSATTVMVVGFVNSGLMALNQAINVIMGANVGTTVTAWVLSLSGIDSSNVFVQLLKPSSFTPLLALIGVVCFMFCKSSKKKDTGLILLGFATLMFGMDTMSSAVSGLRNVPEFQELFLLFTNPLLGVIAGAVLTAIIQSSSASVGILQALSATGSISYGAAVPIIMGQNIGTCVTALISSVGTNKNARRAALVHLSFNIIGTAVWLAVFWLIKAIFNPVLLTEAASPFGIAIAHSIFNLLCTLLLMPMSGLLEKLVMRLIPDGKSPESAVELDERLLATPPIAMERCHEMVADMARLSVQSMHDATAAVKNYTPELAASVREIEEKMDHYEDILGTYLVKLSAQAISDSDSAEATMMLKVIGDFERISDHAVNVIESAEEMKDKELSFSDSAEKELEVLISAVDNILDLSLAAFLHNDPEALYDIEPLEQVIDDIKEQLRTQHIQRLQQGNCTIDVGFVWSDLLTNLERTADHCCNISGSVFDLLQEDMRIHGNLRAAAGSKSFMEKYTVYQDRYKI